MQLTLQTNVKYDQWQIYKDRIIWIFFTCIHIGNTWRWWAVVEAGKDPRFIRLSDEGACLLRSFCAIGGAPRVRKFGYLHIHWEILVLRKSSVRRSVSMSVSPPIHGSRSNVFSWSGNLHLKDPRVSAVNRVATTLRLLERRKNEAESFFRLNFVYIDMDNRERARARD